MSIQKKLRTETLYSRTADDGLVRRTIELYWLEPEPVLYTVVVTPTRSSVTAVVPPDPQTCRDLAAALVEAADRWEAAIDQGER